MQSQVIKHTLKRMTAIQDDSKIFAQLFPSKIRKGERTKLRMIEAAIDAIHDNGVEALTYERVGKKVKMNASQVKYHFPQKELLVQKAIEYTIVTAQKYVIEHIKQKHQWDEKILAIASGFFEWAKQHQKQRPILLHFYYLTVIDPKLKNLHTQMTRMGFERISTILQNESPHSKTMSSQDIRILSRRVWALIDGYMIYTLTTTHYKNNIAVFKKELIRALTHLLTQLKNVSYSSP